MTFCPPWLPDAHGDRHLASCSIAMADREKSDDYETLVTGIDPIDELRAHIGRIEALLAACEDRIDAIPATSDPDRERRLGHLIELIMEAHRATREAVDLGKRLGARRTSPSAPTERGAARRFAQFAQVKAKRPGPQHRRRNAKR